MRKVFNRTASGISKSFRLTEEMESAINTIAEHEGESPTAMIRILLDEILQQKATAKLVPWPDGYDPNKSTVATTRKKKS